MKLAPLLTIAALCCCGSTQAQAPTPATEPQETQTLAPFADPADHFETALRALVRDCDDCGNFILGADGAYDDIASLSRVRLAVVEYHPVRMAQLEAVAGPGVWVGIFGHEIGHEIDATSDEPARNRWQAEIVADEWAGCTMQRAGLDPEVMVRALAEINSQLDGAMSPPLGDRARAVRRGAVRCKEGT